MKKETLEETIERLFKYYPESSGYRKAALIGKEWQQERSYSEEEVLTMLSEVRKGNTVTSSINNRTYWEFDIKSEKKWFEQLKKK